MKNRIALTVLSFAVVLLVGCSLSGPPIEEEIDVAIEFAKEKTNEGMEFALVVALSGDRTELDAFIENEDVDGTLAEVFDEYLAAGGAESNSVSQELLQLFQELGMVVWHGGTEYASHRPGDVLLFTSDGSTWQNRLGSLALVDPYFSHAGIVDPLLYGTDRCILSATIDVSDEGFLSGVTYQSLADLKATSELIVRLPYEMIRGWFWPPADVYSFFYTIFNEKTTDYAFVTLDKNLDAITKENEKYFYCSKVPWYIYDKVPGSDIESDPLVDFYETYSGDPDARWTFQRDSLLYKLYKYFLWREGVPWWKLNERADDHVKAVLRELVTPDELLAFFAYYAGITIP